MKEALIALNTITREGVISGYTIGEAIGWVNLIEVAGLDNHFHRHYPDANEDSIMRFLIKDMRFPRSVDHCLGEIESCLKLMPVSHRLQQIIAQLRHKIAQHNMYGLGAIALHEYLDRLQAELGEIHDALNQRYFHAYDDGKQPIKTERVEFEFAQQ